MECLEGAKAVGQLFGQSKRTCSLRAKNLTTFWPSSPQLAFHSTSSKQISKEKKKKMKKTTLPLWFLCKLLKEQGSGSLFHQFTTYCPTFSKKQVRHKVGWICKDKRQGCLSQSCLWGSDVNEGFWYSVKTSRQCFPTNRIKFSTAHCWPLSKYNPIGFGFLSFYTPDLRIKDIFY